MRPMALSIALLALVALGGCGNPFAPDKQAGAGALILEIGLTKDGQIGQYNPSYDGIL